MKHFHEKLTEQHGIEVRYTFTKDLLQKAGLAQKKSGEVFIVGVESAGQCLE